MPSLTGPWSEINRCFRHHCFFITTRLHQLFRDFSFRQGNLFSLQGSIWIPRKSYIRSNRGKNIFEEPGNGTSRMARKTRAIATIQSRPETASSPHCCRLVSAHPCIEAQIIVARITKKIIGSSPSPALPIHFQRIFHQPTSNQLETHIQINGQMGKYLIPIGPDLFPDVRPLAIDQVPEPADIAFKFL